MLAPRSVVAIAGLSLLGAGCFDASLQETTRCDPSQPEPGTVRIETILCNDLRIPGGDGGVGDVWIATPHYRAIVRGPQASLTSPGASGGTLIDLAPWDDRDTLHEVFPDVSGGWLDVAELSIGDGEITLTGVPEPLLDRGPVRSAAPATVTWLFEADDPWVRLRGSEGMWLHGQGDGQWLGELWHAEDSVIATDHVSRADEGGPMYLNGATALLVGRATETYRQIGTEPVSGIAPGAEALELLEGTERVGLIQLTEEAFDTRVPQQVTGVRSVATGRSPSPTAPPGDTLRLDLGASGAVRVQPRWREGREHPITVSWQVEERTGQAVLPSWGGEVPTGPGEVELSLSAGRTYAPIELTVDIEEGQGVGVEAIWTQEWDTGDWIPVSLSWPGDRSHAWHGSDERASAEAITAGFRFVVSSPLNEVSGSANPSSDGMTLLAQRGSRLVTDSGANIVSWPWTPLTHRAGHGAIDPRGLSPEQALASAAGGPGKDRRTMVDLLWLAEVGEPYSVEPSPWFIWLNASPMVEPDTAWHDWFRWLDARVPLTPAGPVTWTRVPNPDALGRVDVERALNRGHVSAGTGPLISLRVEGAGPGEIAPAQGRWPSLSFEGQLTDANGLQRAALIVNGQVHQTWDVDGDALFVEGSIPEDTRWVVLAGWALDGSDWATTGAIWRDPP